MVFADPQACLPGEAQVIWKLLPCCLTRLELSGRRLGALSTSGFGLGCRCGCLKLHTPCLGSKDLFVHQC